MFLYSCLVGSAIGGLYWFCTVTSVVAAIVKKRKPLHVNDTVGVWG